MKSLTDRQRQVLSFIKDYTCINSCPPTVREVANHFSVSVKAAQDHIAALRKKEYLAESDKRSRSLKIIKGDENEERKPLLITVPILGTIAAGKPIMSSENLDGSVYLPETLISFGKEYFALKVRGDSMTGDGILDGDTAIIEHCETANNGDIVVAVVNEAITLKRFYKEKNRVRLQPSNDAYEPIYCENIRVAGKLVNIIRTY